MFGNGKVVLLLLLSASIARAQAPSVDTARSDCEKFIQDGKNAKNQSKHFFKLMGLSFRFTFNRSSLVEIDQIDPESESNSADTNNTLSSSAGTAPILALIPGLPKMSSDEVSRYQAFKAEYSTQKQAAKTAKTNVESRFKNVTTMDACLTAYAASEKDRQILKTFSDFTAQEGGLLFYELQNETMANVLSSSFKPSDSITLVPGLLVDDIQKALQQTQNATLALVLHSDEVGNLYDMGGNMIFKSTLDQISPVVKTLILYACYSKEVIKNYDLQAWASKRGIQLIGSDPNPHVKWLLGNTTPVILFPEFIKKAKKQDLISNASSEIQSSSPEKPESAYCSMKIKASSLQSGNLGVLLNQKYAGMISPSSQEVQFPCSFLNTTRSNIVTLQNTNLFRSPSFKTNDAQFEASTDQNHFMVDNFYNERGEYVGSKGEMK